MRHESKPEHKKVSEELNQEEYQELYDLIKASYKVIKSRTGYYENTIRYHVFLRAQRACSNGDRKRWNAPRNKIYQALREARRATSNPAFRKLYGATIVNDIFDMIDNISGTKPADIKDSMHELKDAVRNMNRLNEEAKAVSSKCEVIADNLTNICKYVDGEVETININSGSKHTPSL